MKKNFKFYAIAWAILFILFNTIAFAAASVTGLGTATASFWIGYVFIILAFIGQIICAYVALKEDNLKKTFYNVSLIKTSYAGLIASFVFGGLCMVLSPMPYWAGIILCAAVLAFNAIAVVKAAAAIELVNAVDEKVKVNTFFIKSLTVDADGLMARAKSDAVKAECKKVYEAVRYSDPMSHDALASVESEITVKFAHLCVAVQADDAEKVAELASEVVILVNDRNKKCKLLK